MINKEPLFHLAWYEYNDIGKPKRFKFLVSIKNPCKRESPFNYTALVIGKIFRYNIGIPYVKNPFFEPGTYGGEYLAWKSWQSFKYRKYHNFRTPLLLIVWWKLKAMYEKML